MRINPLSNSNQSFKGMITFYPLSVDAKKTNAETRNNHSGNLLCLSTEGLSFDGAEGAAGSTWTYLYHGPNTYLLNMNVLDFKKIIYDDAVNSSAPVEIRDKEIYIERLNKTV